MVFVSSHLISEMALMADRLVVIGQGRLLADTTVAEMSARARRRWRHAFLAMTEASAQYRRPWHCHRQGRVAGVDRRSISRKEASS